MKLRYILAGLLAFGFAQTAAAQDALVCNPETLAQVIQEVEAAPADKKEMAMEELEMAKTKMAENDMEACSGHLTNASNTSKS